MSPRVGPPLAGLLATLSFCGAVSPRIATGAPATLAPSSDLTAQKARQAYCTFLTSAFDGLSADGAALQTLFGCTANAGADDSEGRLKIHVPDLPPSCVDYSGVSAMDKLSLTLQQRVTEHPQHVTSMASADAILVPFSEQLFRDPKSKVVNCSTCATAVVAVLNAIGKRQLFVSLGNPLPGVGSAVHVGSYCEPLWTLPELANARTISYEGYEYGRSDDGQRCEPELPDGRRYRAFQPTTQDWSMSVPYPSAQLGYVIPELVNASKLDNVITFQRTMLAADRPTLCGFLGTDRTAFRKTLMGWMAGGAACKQLKKDEEYGVIKYCLMPDGTTPSRSALYQAMAFGCVPVVFANDVSCAWWDVAVRQHLPYEPRRSFGAGVWSVLINQSAAEASPAHIEETLTAISADEYKTLRATVVALIPRIIYFPHALPGVADAADLVVEAMTRERLSTGLLLAPAAIAEGERLAPKPKPVEGCLEDCTGKKWADKSWERKCTWDECGKCSQCEGDGEAEQSRQQQQSAQQGERLQQSAGEEFKQPQPQQQPPQQQPQQPPQQQPQQPPQQQQSTQQDEAAPPELAGSGCIDRCNGDWASTSWGRKCGWDECSKCSDCVSDDAQQAQSAPQNDQSTKEEEEEEKEEEKEEEQQQSTQQQELASSSDCDARCLENWASTEWGRKCGWGECARCAECASSAATAPAASTEPPATTTPEAPAGCDNRCDTDWSEKDWSTKCSWGSKLCDGCTECATLRTRGRASKLRAARRPTAAL